jgi:hypothetical protein
VIQPTPTQFREHEQVEEVHHAQYYENQADLRAKDLQSRLSVDRLFPIFQCKANETDVNQVKTDHEQVIDRIGQGLIAQETIDQKNTAIFVQCASDPNRQRDADSQINQVRPNSDVITGCFDEGNEWRHNETFLKEGLSVISVITEIIDQIGSIASRVTKSLVQNQLRSEEYFPNKSFDPHVA